MIFLEKDNAMLSDEESRLLASPLEPTDVLGRHKIRGAVENRKALRKLFSSAFARIEPNRFAYKSLSCWSYNIAVGCAHACRFCYVPATQKTANPKDLQSQGGPLNRALRQFGILDPDEQWGDYVLLRPWDEMKFRASLRKAQAIRENDTDSKGRLLLNKDGNRAVFFCSTTDPFQTIRNSNPEKQKVLNKLREFLVRRALELILTESTLNVRILTRSAPAEADWEIIRKLALQNRVLFGVSLPTLDDNLRKVYEPRAPGPQSRLRTLQRAVEYGVPVYVAMAPTFPECDEADLRRTLTEIKLFNPLTIFHEPINIRAKNVERIQRQAQELGISLMTDVFRDTLTWRIYAIQQLQLVESIAAELDLTDRLHLWPDPDLGSESAFLAMRGRAFLMKNPNLRESRLARAARDANGKKVFHEEFHPWLKKYWTAISAWPRKEQIEEA